MVKTTDCGSVMRGFESHYPPIKIPITFVIGIFICEKFGNSKNPIRRSLIWVRADFLQSAEDFSLEETEFLKRKSVVTFNAKNPRQRIFGRAMSSNSEQARMSK